MIPFDTFTLVVLRGAGEHGDEVQDAHMAFLRSMQDAGHLLAAGPLLAAGDQRGIALWRTDVAETLELASADPAVIAGSFVVEAHAWMVPAGTISFSPGTLPRSIAEVRG